MIVKHEEGRTEYGPGVSIELTGDEVATAIDAWLVAHGVHISGPRTVRVNGELCESGRVYVDPSGYVIADGEKISGRGERIDGTTAEALAHEAFLAGHTRPVADDIVNAEMRANRIGTKAAVPGVPMLRALDSAKQTMGHVILQGNSTDNEIEVLAEESGPRGRIRIRERHGVEIEKCSIFLTPDQLEEHARGCSELAAKIRRGP